MAKAKKKAKHKSKEKKAMDKDKDKDHDDKARADKERTDKALHKERTDRPGSEHGPSHTHDPSQRSPFGDPQGGQLSGAHDHEGNPGRGRHIDNRDHDPHHPANTTQSPHREPGQRSEAEAFGIPPDELLTEQEKDAMAGGAASDGNVPGVGPAAASEHTSGPVETIEDQGIGPKTPYPTGDPPPPAESTSRSQGIKGVTDKPSVKPSESSGPAGQVPEFGDRDAANKADAKNEAEEKANKEKVTHRKTGL